MPRRTELIPLLTCVVVAAAGLFDGAHAPLPAMVVGACFAGLIAWWIGATKSTFEPAELWVAGVLLWACMVTAARWSGLLEAKLTVASWCFAWFVWCCCRRAGSRLGGWSLALLATASVAVAGAAIVEAMGAGHPGSGGFFVNPNFAAAILVPTCLALWTVSALGNPRNRALRAAAATVMVAGVLTTGSRAALLALVVAAAVALPRGRLRFIGVAAAAAAAGAVIAWRFAVQPDHLAWHRPAIWEALVELVAEHPITGIGPGAFGDFTGPLRLSVEGGIASHLHHIGGAESTILGVIVRLGLVGFVLAAAAVVAWLRGLRSASFFAGAHRRAMLAAIVVFCLVHDQLDARAVLWWWAALIGAVEATAGTARSSTHLRWSPPRVLAAVAACGVALWAVVQPALARQMWWSAEPTREHVNAVLRVERWFTEPPSGRVRQLLASPSWGWGEAAEAIDLSSRAVATDRGKAALWANLGKVHMRVIDELGPWPDSVSTARDAFAHATSLEPHLPWTWLHWARLERSLGNLDHSRKLAGRAVGEERNFVGGWLFFARVELDRGQVEAARQALAQAHRAMAVATDRPPANPYEEDLLAAPAWQLQELELALR